MDQKNKLQRADRELKTAYKAIKQRAISREFLELYNRDLDLRELEKRNMDVLNQLGDLAYADDELGPKIARQLLNRGLKMPHMMQKSRSSMSWRSDTSYEGMSLSSSKGKFDFFIENKNELFFLLIFYFFRNVHFAFFTIRCFRSKINT